MAAVHIPAELVTGRCLSSDRMYLLCIGENAFTETLSCTWKLVETSELLNPISLPFSVNYGSFR